LVAADVGERDCLSRTWRIGAAEIGVVARSVKCSCGTERPCIITVIERSAADETVKTIDN
jgi:hypothetical protein